MAFDVAGFMELASKCMAKEVENSTIDTVAGLTGSDVESIQRIIDRRLTRAHLSCIMEYLEKLGYGFQIYRVADVEEPKKHFAEDAIRYMSSLVQNWAESADFVESQLRDAYYPYFLELLTGKTNPKHLDEYIVFVEQYGYEIELEVKRVE